jgi:arylsulfatase A-like enzyme
MFEGGLRVPVLARWPAQLPAGRVTDEFLTSLEIFPTLTRIAGLEPPKDVHLDGFNMLKTRQGKQSAIRKEMFWQRRSDRAARVGHYKWVESASGSGLFDLSKDLGEKHDLSRDHPDLLKQLQERFTAWREQMDATEPRGPFRNY